MQRRISFDEPFDKAPLLLEALTQNSFTTPTLLLTLIVQKGLYPATEKNTATERLCAGNGIDFIRLDFSSRPAGGCCSL